MTGKGRRLIISDAMTESGPVRGLCGRLKLTVKEKKRKIESKSKELSGEKKRRKLDSESTEKKEDTVDGGEKKITFPDKSLRAELWTLVKFEREKFPNKVMETVAKEYGHEILRLPP